MWYIYFVTIFALAHAQNKLVAEPLIVNGWDAPIGVFLSQASLRSDIYNNRNFCGGSVIGKKWILTSARCLSLVDPSKIQVFLGSNKLSSGGVTYEVDSVLVHENFTHRPIQNDLGIIKLAKDIEFNDKVKAIELDEKFVEPNDEYVVTGWGNDDSLKNSEPDNLQMIQVTILSDKTCSTSFRRGRTTFKEGLNMCSLDQGKGVCEGDEGGPLTRGDKLVGVVSFSMGCGSGRPTLYTRVSAYIDWIRGHTKE